MLQQESNFHIHPSDLCGHGRGSSAGNLSSSRGKTIDRGAVSAALTLEVVSRASESNGHPPPHALAQVMRLLGNTDIIFVLKM